MHPIVYRSIIYNSQDIETIQVLINRQVDQGAGYIDTMEYFSALKNEIQLSVATWKDLENTMLSEISQTDKNKHEDVTYTSNLKIYICI